MVVAMGMLADRPSVGAAQLRRNVRRGVQRLRRIRQANRQAARCAAVVGNRHEAQLCRCRQHQRAGITQAASRDRRPRYATIGRVLPDALRRAIGGIADDGDTAQQRGRGATGHRVGCIRIVGAGNQGGNKSARRVGAVFIDRGERCRARCEGGVIDRRDRGTQGHRIGRVRVSRRAAGGRSRKIRPGPAGYGAGRSIDQAYRQLPRRAVPVARGQKAHLVRYLEQEGCCQRRRRRQIGPA